MNVHADSYLLLLDKNIFNTPAEARRHKNKRSLPFYCSLIKHNRFNTPAGGGDIKTRGLFLYFPAALLKTKGI